LHISFKSVNVSQFIVRHTESVISRTRCRVWDVPLLCVCRQRTERSFVVDQFVISMLENGAYVIQLLAVTSAYR